MIDEHPYVAPSTTSVEAAVVEPSRPSWPTGILLFIGTCFLLVLNGQHFTNRLVFLGFVAASAFLWYRYRLRVHSRDSNAGRLALLVHLILLIALAATLPNAYLRQNRFNNATQRIKTQSQTPTR